MGIFFVDKKDNYKIKYLNKHRKYFKFETFGVLQIFFLEFRFIIEFLSQLFVQVRFGFFKNT